MKTPLVKIGRPVKRLPRRLDPQEDYTKIFKQVNAPSHWASKEARAIWLLLMKDLYEKTIVDDAALVRMLHESHNAMAAALLKFDRLAARLRKSPVKRIIAHITLLKQMDRDPAYKKTASAILKRFDKEKADCLACDYIGASGRDVSKARELLRRFSQNQK